MNIVITLAVLTAAKNLVIAMAETKEPGKELHQKSSVETPSKAYLSTAPTYSVKLDPTMNSLNSPHSGAQNSEQDAKKTQSVVFRPAISLTRIAKSRNYGFDPYFSKGYFEPFESRPKPIVLVAFRKNGLIPRQSIKVKSDKASEAAELQSPYNDVGSFWQDDMGLTWN